jgi:hypothetical protein
MSNSFPERNQTSLLEVLETVFNRDYTAERFWSPNHTHHGAQTEVEL